MTETTLKESVKKVYEIGYLLISSVPEEKVAGIVSSLKDILTKKNAEVIAEEAPELRMLAYTMIKKIGTAHQRFDQGYFGWIKFEVSTSEIESIKKAFEMHPDMLRILVVTTIRENTYLGKKTPVAPGLLVNTEEVVATEALPLPEGDKASTATIEEMDKSIDEMVKEA